MLRLWGLDFGVSFLFLGGGVWNRPVPERGNPTSYRRDSFGSVAIIYIAYFNRISQTYLTFTTPHGFIYYIIRMIVLRNSEYKPLGLKENKQKVETISSLLSKLHLHESSPQAARSVARAILHIFFICRSVDSFTLILHLSGYPQGRDRFMSPSVCKLLVDANSIKIRPRIGYGFLYKQYN